MRLARTIFCFLPIALCGCAAPAARVSFDSPSKSQLFAWDGSGQDPNRHRRVKIKRAELAGDENDANHEREKLLAAQRPYSAAWWAIHDEIEADHDRRLARKLVICAGCWRDSPPNDVTATIPSERIRP
jgi:hypothetical protein